MDNLCLSCKWGSNAPPYNNTKFYCAKKQVIDENSHPIGRKEHLKRSIVDVKEECEKFEERMVSLHGQEKAL